MVEYKYILGIQSFSNMDSGACIVKASTDGEILDYIAISEERLIRIKYPYVFPIYSLGYCMDYFNLKSLDQIDILVTDYIRIKRWFNSGPSYNISDFDYLKIKFNIDPRKIRIISHHMAHATSTYYASGFDEAAILVIDMNGSDVETTSYFKGEKFDISLLENYKFHGIGACYSVITKRILNLGTGGEGKTMGLAPYGKNYKRVLNFNTKLDGIKNDFSDFIQRMPYSDVLNQIDPNQRINPLKKEYLKCNDKRDLLNPYFSRVAYDAQEETERVMVHLAKDLYSKTKCKNICITGGVGLNSVANKKILDETEFENIFIFPACSDAGIPIGLALGGYYNLNEIGNFKRKKLVMKNAYTGIEYSEEYCLKVFEKYNIQFEKTKLSDIAKLISEGKIVGWFQGGSEYGPRALGHRSILADSRDKNMKDILNSKIKHRESFRPFAPSILLEYANEYFDLDCPSPFMLLIAKVKNPEAIPAITHVDNTARIQTVTKEENGIYYDIINEFYKITGIPCILNTSFNDAGEPIVETPEDAIMCFLSTEMDYLLIGAYLLDSKKIKQNQILDKMKSDREEKIKKRKIDLIKKFFTGYNEEERDYFIEESNKISEWYTKYKCEYELEKKVHEWAKNNKKILIIGTKDHTNLLPKYINGFGYVNIVGFINFEEHFDKYPYNEIDYKEYNLKDIKDLKYDELLISSYEYNFVILEILRKMKLKKLIYPIYDNTSRSFFDIFENKLPLFKFKEDNKCF